MVCEHRDIARTILTIEGDRRLLFSMRNPVTLHLQAPTLKSLNGILDLLVYDCV